MPTRACGTTIRTATSTRTGARALGSALLPRTEARLRQIARSHEQKAPPLLVTWIDGPDTGARALVERNGYRMVRTYHFMVRPDLDDIEAPAPPDGIVIRSVTREELRKVWDAMSEAFRDHFGAFDAGERAMQAWLESPAEDPRLYVVAFDGDDIAGAVHGLIYVQENRANGYRRGWTDPVYVRRPWRRRGLASALLGRALTCLREAGMTFAQLDVDTENENRASTLYERHGFATDRRATEWHKPLNLDE